MDSSSALESYGPLLYNAPSLANIGAVLAMIQHETSSLTLDVKSMKHKTMQFSFINQQSLYEGVRPRPLSPRRPPSKIKKSTANRTKIMYVEFGHHTRKKGICFKFLAL